MRIKISKLPETEIVQEDDELVLVQNGITKKIKNKNLMTNVDSPIKKMQEFISSNSKNIANIKQDVDSIDTKLDSINSSISVKNDNLSEVKQTSKNNQNEINAISKNLLEKDKIIKSIEDSLKEIQAKLNNFSSTGDSQDLDKNISLDNKLYNINNYLNILKDNSVPDFLDDEFMLINTYTTSNSNIPIGTPILYLSKDGVNMFPISFKQIYKEDLCWDYSTIFYNNSFYFAYDCNDNGINKIKIVKTSDWKVFDERELTIPNNFKIKCSPEFFIDDNKDVYILISMSDGLTKQRDVRNGEVFLNKIYIAKFKDNDLKTTEDFREIRFNDTNNSKIDPFLFKKDSKFYLLFKDDIDKQIKIYRSDSLDNSYSYLKTLPFSVESDAPSVVYYNNKYWCYCDGVEDGTYRYMTSLDLENWSCDGVVDNMNNINIRHFTPLIINDENAKEILNKFIKSNGKDVFSEAVINNEMYGTSLDGMVDLSKIAINGEVNNLTLMKNNVYTIYGDNRVTVRSYDSSNLKNGDRVYFVASTDSNGSLTLARNDGIFLSCAEDFTMNKNLKNNETIFEFVKICGNLRMVSSINTNLIKEDSPYPDYGNRVDLNSISNNGTIDSLKVKPNVVYCVDSENKVVINSIDTSEFYDTYGNKRGECYFAIFSRSPNANITFKNGRGMYVPEDSYELKGKGLNDVLITFCYCEGVMRMKT